LGTNAIVKINNEFTGKSEVQTGVKQGDPLSAKFFIIAMDSILKKMELRGNISTRLRQCTAYADDILITVRTTQAMIDTFMKLKKRIPKIWPNSKCTQNKISEMFQETRPVKTHKYWKQRN